MTLIAGDLEMKLESRALGCATELWNCAEVVSGYIHISQGQNNFGDFSECKWGEAERASVWRELQSSCSRLSDH